MSKVQIYSGGSSPSGISGSIQFNDNGAFGSDASNLFWDDTNNRLGIGTNVPSSKVHIKGIGNTNSTKSFRYENTATAYIEITDDGAMKFGLGGGASTMTSEGLKCYKIIGSNTSQYISMTGGVTIYSADGSQSTYFDDAYTAFTDSISIGQTSAPSARLHVKGLNDSTGSALKVQSATYEAINVYNNRQIVFGGGSAVANTDYTFSAFSSTSTGNVMVVQNIYGEQIIRVKADGSTANGGLDIHRGSLTGRYALRIIGNTSTSFVIKTSGSMGWQYEATLSELKADQGAAIIGLSGDVGFKGINHYVGTSTYSHVFTGAITRSNGVSLVALTGSYSEANASGDTIMMGITPTYNYTGTGSRNIVGLKYSPTLTAITGKNYGLLIESGLNGFGLGATKPVAYIHIGAGTDSIPQMKLESSVAPTGGALTDGTIWFDGTNLKMRIGGLTKTFTIV